MTSTGHKGPFSEGSSVETILLPKGKSESPDKDRSPTKSTSPRGGEDKAWKPSFDRRQSWNEQDLKHQFQERLLKSEKGNESGFSETKHKK